MNENSGEKEKAMRNLAIIPARSGSKGLVNKNIKLMNGKPLIAYTIEAAIESNVFEEIFVSTDSAEYADIARKYGANVPFLRSMETAGDSSSAWDVVRETLQKYKELRKGFDTIALLQPTSPLRQAGDIIKGYELMVQKEANAIVAVCETDHSPLWCNVLPDDLSMQGFVSDRVLNKPRQELPTYYRVNGALYIVKTSMLKDDFDLYSNKCYAYTMDKKYSIDIDEELDFQMAQLIMQTLT